MNFYTIQLLSNKSYGLNLSSYLALTLVLAIANQDNYDDNEEYYDPTENSDNNVARILGSLRNQWNVRDKWAVGSHGSRWRHAVADAGRPRGRHQTADKIRARAARGAFKFRSDTKESMAQYYKHCELYHFLQGKYCND